MLRFLVLYSLIIWEPRVGAVCLSLYLYLCVFVCVYVFIVHSLFVLILALFQVSLGNQLPLPSSPSSQFVFLFAVICSFVCLIRYIFLMLCLGYYLACTGTWQCCQLPQQAHALLPICFWTWHSISCCWAGGEGRLLSSATIWPIIHLCILYIDCL